MLLENKSNMRKLLPFIALAFSIFAFFMGRASMGKLTKLTSDTGIEVEKNNDQINKVLVKVDELEKILSSGMPIDNDDLSYIVEQTDQIESELKLQEIDESKYSGIYKDLTNIKSQALTRWRTTQRDMDLRTGNIPVTREDNIPMTKNGTQTKTIRIPVDSVSNFSDKERVNRFNN